MNFGNVANSGIKNKVFAQAKAFNNLGLATDVLYFENKTIKIEGKNQNIQSFCKSKIDFLKFLYFGYLSAIDVKKYDFVYIRHFLTNPLFLWMLKSIKKQNPSIKIYMELPTYPYKYQNNKLSFSLRIQQKIDEVCTPFFKKYIDQIVTISLHDTIFDIPTIKTDNGIDVEKFGPIKPQHAEDGILNLLGLANVQSWHGFDRLIAGISNYVITNPLKKVILHVVGNGDVLEDLKKQTKDNNLSDYVKFHGFLSGNELIEMFAKCQMGVGVLGLHRVNLSHASALKAREFASRGLPFMASHDDFGFPDGYPFILKLPASDEAIDVNLIVNFVEKLKEFPNYHLVMNKYAIENFTWESKLKPVRDKFIEN
ncbi:glycosyltransferase family 1 protein [Lacihabitans soyangensis]|uniref:Glycosyltransferase family 1 protein n=2 Tax=Lacihabitans soyangensis TaxID=869394 RepID=A0AAE3H8Q3_9BACT|nr:glycosyltransferase family 1 protein [Lacihabitans soyangensis]